jgi:RNA polymerase sigma-70 factor, ECF subfamily
MTTSRADLEAALRAHCERGAHEDATEAAIRGYGPEILEYLTGVSRSETDAADAFALFCEDVWRGMPAFRWDSSFRTWAYAIAHRALMRIHRSPHRKSGRAIPLSRAPKVAAVAVEVRTSTVQYLRTSVKDRFASVRAELDPEDQALLELRIQRQLSWPEVARILLAGDAPSDEADDTGGPEDTSLSVEPDAAAIERKAAMLRKRFERLKETLRARRDDIFGE